MEKASALSDEKLVRLLEDLPSKVLYRMEVYALTENVDITNPRLYRKISEAAKKREVAEFSDGGMQF